jgi:L-ribulose-5-phosphate 4-epimerase
VAKAVEVAVAAEYCAHMALMSLRVAPGLTSIESALLKKHFHRKHGPGAYYGQKRS